MICAGLIDGEMITMRYGGRVSLPGLQLRLLLALGDDIKT